MFNSWTEPHALKYPPDNLVIKRYEFLQILDVAQRVALLHIDKTWVVKINNNPLWVYKINIREFSHAYFFNHSQNAYKVVPIVDYNIIKNLSGLWLVAL